MSDPDNPSPKALGPRFRGDERRGGGIPWALTLVVIPALCLLIGLGVWQVQRLQWKQGLIASAQTAATRPPVPVADLGPDPAEFTRVVLDCDFLDPAHGLVELQSIHDGQSGVRLISTCSGYLIDLGFIPDTVTARPAQGGHRERTGATPTVTAEVRETPPPGPMALAARSGRFYVRDNAAIAVALGEPAADERRTLYAQNSAFPEFSPLTPVVPPAAFSNNHLGYAITWFGLALVLVGFYVALLRRRLRKPTS